MSNLELYESIMDNYRKGIYGSENLTVSEILKRAGHESLLKQLNQDELNILREKASGITKLLFS